MTIADLDASLDTSPGLSRSKRLKEATQTTHEGLDQSIMAHHPFADRAHYGLFVTLQHQFHGDIDALYANPELSRLLPDLAGRRRLPFIEQDLRDLGIVPAIDRTKPEFSEHADIDIPTALGWLYVAEGSNLGAAFLLKAAGKLGLSETSGARHLAAAPEGRGLHWKTFTAALDAIDLTAPEEERAAAGARAAFARVQDLVNDLLARRA